ncbi:alpha/beta hydrolase [Paraflavitalea speifideaquila]|uniref:alpha/beta hydrolase n=1 Tax=Paraflavitalea speifideaquila TaxID=3076558 RepID=UPI0028E3D16C|nr:alpha/beta hydrolase [Paraflavitalea speifideiaquila]
MDLYLPTNGNSSSTKLMILIHGGAWADGDKADFDEYITELQRRLPDYAFANINYRLYSSTGQNKFPAQEEDVKAAVGFLLNKSGIINTLKTSSCWAPARAANWPCCKLISMVILPNPRQ